VYSNDSLQQVSIVSILFLTEAHLKLINCPDCDRLISQDAPACPGCGRPIAEASPPRSDEPYFPPPREVHSHVTTQETGTFEKGFGCAFGIGCGIFVFLGVVREIFAALGAAFGD